MNTKIFDKKNLFRSLKIRLFSLFGGVVIYMPYTQCRPTRTKFALGLVLDKCVLLTLAMQAKRHLSMRIQLVYSVK